MRWSRSVAGVRAVERLEPLGALDPLADHVDGADQLAALGGVFGQDLGQVELAVAGLGEQAAADFLGAVVPEPGVEPGIPPADGAIPLDVPDQVRLGGLGRQGGQADHQRDRGRPDRRGPGRHGRARWPASPSRPSPRSGEDSSLFTTTSSRIMHPFIPCQVADFLLTTDGDRLLRSPGSTTSL